MKTNQTPHPPVTPEPAKGDGGESGPLSCSSSWILTKDSAPDHFERVLTAFKGEGLAIGSQVDGKWRMHPNWKCPAGKGYLITDMETPEFWMPIPDFPKNVRVDARLSED